MDQFKAFSQQLNPLAAKLGKQFGQVKQVTSLVPCSIVPGLPFALFSHARVRRRAWSGTLQETRRSSIIYNSSFSTALWDQATMADIWLPSPVTYLSWMDESGGCCSSKEYREGTMEKCRQLQPTLTATSRSVIIIFFLI